MKNFFVELVDCADEIPKVDAQSVICGFLLVGDELLKSKEEDRADDRRTVSIAARLLNIVSKKHSHEDRIGILRKALEKSRAVAVGCHLLTELTTKPEGSNISDDAKPLSEEEIARLREVWIERVQFHSCNSNLLECPDLQEVLSCWNEWGEGNQAQKWCDKLISTDQGLLDLLNALLQHGKSVSAEEIRNYTMIDREWLGGIIDSGGAE